MRNLLFIFPLVLAACAAPPQTSTPEVITVFVTATPKPTEEDKMQLTMAAGQTQNAIWQATQDARPTITPRPSKTPTARPTPTPAPDIEEVRAGVLENVVGGLLSIYDVEEINLARLVDGVMDIEVRTTFISQAHQPDVSYVIIQFLSEIFGKQDNETINKYTGTDHFAVKLVTYSSGGDYPYESFTELETLHQIYNRTISYEEWVTAANAEFR